MQADHCLSRARRELSTRYAGPLKAITEKQMDVD